MGGVDQWGVGCESSFPWLELHRNNKSLSCARLGSKYARVGLTITMLAKV